MSPQMIEKCVQALMSDPEFVPQEGQSKEESAWAICSAQMQEQEAIASQLERR